MSASHYLHAMRAAPDCARPRGFLPLARRSGVRQAERPKPPRRRRAIERAAADGAEPADHHPVRSDPNTTVGNVGSGTISRQARLSQQSEFAAKIVP